MTDDTTPAAAKPDLTPEQQANRAIARAIARALARVEGGGAAELKKRWTDDRKKYLTDGRKLAKLLAKEGVTLTHTPKAAKGEGRGKTDA